MLLIFSASSQNSYHPLYQHNLLTLYRPKEIFLKPYTIPLSFSPINLFSSSSKFIIPIIADGYSIFHHRSPNSNEARASLSRALEPDRKKMLWEKCRFLSLECLTASTNIPVLCPDKIWQKQKGSSYGAICNCWYLFICHQISIVF